MPKTKKQDKTDPRLVYMIDQSIYSMERNEGIRAGFYIRAAHDFIHGIKSNKLEIALENYEELKNAQN